MSFAWTNESNPIIIPELERYTQIVLLFQEIHERYNLPHELATYVMIEFVAPYFKAQREDILIHTEYMKVLRSEHEHHQFTLFKILSLLNDPLIDFMHFPRCLTPKNDVKFQRLVPYLCYALSKARIIDLPEVIQALDVCILLGNDNAFLCVRRLNLDKYCVHLDAYVRKKTDIVNNLMRWSSSDVRLVKTLIWYYLDRGTDDDDDDDEEILVEWFIVAIHKTGLNDPLAYPTDYDAPPSINVELMRIKEKARSPEYKERRRRLIIEGK